MTPSPRTALARWMERPWFLTLWTVIAAFGAYGSMYGFRKPFTAGVYLDTSFGAAMKTWLVTAQVLGYTLSKVIGIRLIAGITPGFRALVFVALIAAAELSLLGFALTPAPVNTLWLFTNGLALGLVFGLVLGFVEGRRMTELFIAGLCASFILADGVAKSVGAWLLSQGVAERWMPAAAGGLFAPALLLFVWMLNHIPRPSTQDVEARSERTPMTALQRRTMLARHGIRLFAIVAVYLLITVLRSIRADFAPEIWTGLGLGNQPGIFAQSELWVTLGVVALNGSVVLINDNRRAFFSALGLATGGLLLALGALVAQGAGLVSPFAFMVLLGLGMYLPYVAVHTTLFERLIALTRERGNIGYLMYLADAAGYLGYAAVMIGRSAFPSKEHFLSFFLNVAAGLLLTALAAAVAAWGLYLRRAPKSEAEA